MFLRFFSCSIGPPAASCVFRAHARGCLHVKDLSLIVLELRGSSPGEPVFPPAAGRGEQEREGSGAAAGAGKAIAAPAGAEQVGDPPSHTLPQRTDRCGVGRSAGAEPFRSFAAKRPSAGLGSEPRATTERRSTRRTLPV